MTSDLDGYGGEPDVRWVKTQSGENYLCPVAILEFIDELSEKDLKAICVSESLHRNIN